MLLDEDLMVDASSEGLRMKAALSRKGLLPSEQACSSFCLLIALNFAVSCISLLLLLLPLPQFSFLLTASTAAVQL